MAAVRARPVVASAVGLLGLSVVGCVAALLGLSVVAHTACAQEIEFTPRTDHPVERRLEAFLDREPYSVWTRDTVLLATDTVAGSLLVLEAAVRIAGRIEGSVYVVDGDLFLRPGARIAGEVVVLGGGYYGSQLATTKGKVTYRPTDAYRVMPKAGGYLIYPVEEVPPALDLHGLYGLRLPTYQRVNEWTFAWGGIARATGLAWQPSLELIGRFHTEQGELEGTLRQFWHPTAEWQFGFEVERATRSHDEWMRGDALNSFSYLFVGDDFRDYYRADRAAFVVARVQEWTPSLTVQWEDARSLEARSQTVFFGEDAARLNPVIDEGDTWSATAALKIRRRTPNARLSARLALEAADSTVAGDFSFLLIEGQVLWEGGAFLDHSLELFGIGRGDLAGTLPRQRWSGLGGRMTLPTFPVLGLRGPRLLFGQVTYLIPVRALRLGPLGTPRLFARGSIGTVWEEGRTPRFEQNVSFGARLLGTEVAVAVDPGEGDALVFARIKVPGTL